MNFDEMPWLVTDTTSEPSQTHGPLSKDTATRLRDHLRSEGRSAEAWAAQVPDKRKLVA